MAFGFNSEENARTSERGFSGRMEYCQIIASLGASQRTDMWQSHKSDTETHGSVPSADDNLRSNNKPKYISVPK
jgi:hypothetical protein